MADKIVDPAKYREMSEPFASADDAKAAINEFWEQLYALRCDHGIADVLVTLRVSLMDGDEEVECMVSMHAGSSMNQEAMAAWAFGQAQAKRQAEVARMLADAKSVSVPGDRK